MHEKYYFCSVLSAYKHYPNKFEENFDVLEKKILWNSEQIWDN